MESWNHPAYRPSEGTTTMTAVPREDPGGQTDPDLLTRTSWVNAGVAYREIKKGRAEGNTCALWLRSHLQNYLYSLGCFIQLHCGKVLFVGLLLLSLCCIGLKTAIVETNVEELWVEEGGRLEKELAYTRKTIGEESGTLSDIIIQTPKTGNNILSTQNLQLHLQSVLKATEIEVKLYGRIWGFEDVCYKSAFPMFDGGFIDKLIDQLVPCVIISPLDCFWEGAKALGPRHPINIPGLYDVKWTNLNPQKIIQDLEKTSIYSYFDFEMVNEVFERADIRTAYQERPCLNPLDPECPKTAPNKISEQAPDIGAELTGGCSGLSNKYMHWEEDLIVGGVSRNKTGHIVRAEALQTILQVMGEREMYEFHQFNEGIKDFDWTKETAKEILEAWQRKFAEEINSMKNESFPSDVYGFTLTSLLDIMKDFSTVSIVRVAIGYILMVVYACISLLRWNDAVNSQSGIGIAGVLLVALSVAAGLGMCSVLGIKFNASTTQIIPFLALGLGVDDMFLIAHTYAENANNRNIAISEQTGECLKRTGVSVLLTSFSNMMAFLAASIIPIPALRAFSLQAAILVLFNVGSILLVYPAIVSLDLMRREGKRVDVFCCFQESMMSSSSTRVIDIEAEERPSRQATPPPSYNGPPSYNTVVTQTTSERTQTVTSLANNRHTAPGCPSTTSSQQCLTTNNGLGCRARCVQTKKDCLRWSLTCFATNYYIPTLQKTPIKVFTIVFFILFLTFSGWGTARVKDGLDLTDIVPRGTPEYKFLEAQAKYFGFYQVYAVTKDNFDYAEQQPLLHEYHQSFKYVDKILKGEGGSLPPFWLEVFREWLMDLQRAFDKDTDSGKIVSTGWYNNASDDGILAFKLLVQTGNVKNPYNMEQVLKNRLVDEKNIINKNAFYNYLTAWVSNDLFAYSATMANLHPLPQQWIHEPGQYDYFIPKAQPLIYTQLSFYLTNLSATQDITETIIAMREICDKFVSLGLPNYPSGVPFTFWEQYINLRFYLMLAILCVLGVTFFVMTIVLCNPWIAIVVVLVLTMLVVELFGFMGLIGIKLSAIPAVILIVAVGIGVEFTVHISVGFITSIGSRDRRMSMSLEHTFAPVIHGAVSTLLGIIMLAGAEFDFIVKYFFNVLVALVFLGIINGLLLLPVLLSLFGPKGEVIPKDDPDRICSPTPQPSPIPVIERPVRFHRRIYPRIPSEISLTTISEEATQYSSHEIIVEPQVIVETTTGPNGIIHTTTNISSNGISRSSSRNNSPQMQDPSMPSTTHVTRVKATATVKVEVHTPLPGTVNQEHSYKSKRRKLKELEISDSDSSKS